jgi:signal transduction histidine kinase
MVQLSSLKDSGLDLPQIEALAGQLQEMAKDLDIEYILEDIPNLIAESREGMDRIKKIVLDLKDFSHPGEDVLKLSDLNLNLDSTLNIVWNELKYKATIIKDYSPNLPQVKCYPQQLNQVIMNILVNAAHAIEKQGEIRIITRETAGLIEIVVSDTGQGIPKENLSRIFDPFFTSKEVGKGTGLGLNVAYNIIKKHQGTIDVQSEVGIGTTFTIRIPVNGPETSPPKDVA